MSEQSTETFLPFWNGPFSQWYGSAFILSGMMTPITDELIAYLAQFEGDAFRLGKPNDQIRFDCNEQYMMAEKALLFKDYAAFKAIMETDSPREQKALGRKVKGFDTETWEKIACPVVYRANRAKFEQNPELKKTLLDSAPATIVEASPYDKIWGIGRDEKDPRCHDRSKWDGRNWLGEILTQVRDELIEETSGKT